MFCRHFADAARRLRERIRTFDDVLHHPNRSERGDAIVRNRTVALSHVVVSESPITRTLTHRILAALLTACILGRGAYVLYLVHAHAIVTDSGDAPSYLGPARQLFEHGRFTA